MWRRTSLLLLLVRLFFALSPSYLHPDENFQGPEVVAGQVFGYPVKLTWEFTSDAPIRSIFPLWPIYGLPMLLLKWLWIGNGSRAQVEPIVVFWTLRVLMFLLSFVLEDWAIQELVSTSRRQRKVALLLLSSSYVTWTFQTHTFSNSVETLLVAWSLVLIQRIVDDKRHASIMASGLLGFLVVFGVFNRVTFIAFLFLPGLSLIYHFWRQPLSLIVLIGAALCTLIIGIAVDTDYYSKSNATFSSLFTHPVITPLNNLRYNLQTQNLAIHGIHPWYQHLIINLPMLLGPAFLLLFLRPTLSTRLWSAISGVAVLSCISHQEARFLLPAVPLILSSVRLPTGKNTLRIFIAAWLTYNIFMGVVMGIYHQGGVFSGQVFLSRAADAKHAVWWKTYSPPIWFLNGKNEQLTTYDIMGVPGHQMMEKLRNLTPCGVNAHTGATYLVAPLSVDFLDSYLATESTNPTLRTGNDLKFDEVWRQRQHLSLEDLDISEDGLWPTFQRVVGRRGLAIWKVSRICDDI